MVVSGSVGVVDVGGVMVVGGVGVVVMVSESVGGVIVGGVIVSGGELLFVVGDDVEFRLVNSFILVLATQTSTLGSKLH